MSEVTKEIEVHLNSEDLDKFQKLEHEESNISTSAEDMEVDQKQMDKIYRHLDYRIIPALWCLYFLTSYGSSAYGVSLTMNSEQNHSLKQSLHLTPHHTSTASALYYVGYIIFDVPMNLIMTKMAPQAWLSRIVITVGLVYTCYSALDNAKGVVAIRFISGMCGAGTWPGMSYYISLWYPNHRSAKRIGYYFTAAQISAAAAGLVSAGFQKMDTVRGYYGWQWMFLVYGVITIACGISLIWWLPDRPFHILEDNEEEKPKTFFTKIRSILPRSSPPLNEHERELHKIDMKHRFKHVEWTFNDLKSVMLDLRIWPLIMMYFGVVGTGFGLAVFGSTIIAVENPGLSSIDVSLLYAPIWLFDLGGILVVTPFADRYKNHRGIMFSLSTVIIMVGMFVTTFAHGPWNKYAGLLIAGFGLGPTVPICMAWTAEIFYPIHGDVGTAVSAALVSGLGNLGSVTATYALYSGWPADQKRLYRDSNMMLIVMLGFSIISAGACTVLRKYLGDFDEKDNIAPIATENLENKDQTDKIDNVE